ncbi:hypothetical protein KDL44_00625 [bacterium]|nr:hypothetical protein [bacterium]
MQTPICKLITCLMLLSVSACAGRGFPLNYTPKIEAISHSSGRNGDSIKFKAIITRQPYGEDLHYFWDFGGIGEPRFSEAAEPEVRISGVPGVAWTETGQDGYRITLTVTEGKEHDAPANTFSAGFEVLPGDGLEIEEVSSGSGVSGDSKTFVAVVTGQLENSVLSYHWEFGPGADPASSTEAEPQVKLGIPAEAGYIGQLSVTEVAGAKIRQRQQTFRYVVEQLSVIAVEPLTGEAGKMISLQLSANGSFDEAEWGIEGFDQEDLDAQAGTITGKLPSAAGSYQGNVTVSNAHGSSDEFSFTLTVTEPEESEPGN